MSAPGTSTAPSTAGHGESENGVDSSVCVPPSSNTVPFHARDLTGAWENMGEDEGGDLPQEVRSYGSPGSLPADDTEARIDFLEQIEGPQFRENEGALPSHPAAGADSSVAAPGGADAKGLAPLSVGLVNERSTCYLNALLQSLFSLGVFRNAVYCTPVVQGGAGSRITKALQELFFQMQKGSTPARTNNLTAAFGWEEEDLGAQHDIQEMATLLREKLEEEMKGTPVGGTISQLFQGLGEQVVETLDGAFTSTKRDTFYDIHLPLVPYTTLMESLRSLSAKEQLVGDDKYRVEVPGKEPQYKDAEKSYRFCRFPPVTVFHLKRFQMNFDTPTPAMEKISSRFVFPVVLSLDELEKGIEAENPSSTSAIYELQSVIVHHGSENCGHYVCYIREWDPVQECFARWIEYDDERVTVVDECRAVTKNYGGQQPGTSHSGNTTKLHTAYVLSYVRRADCPKVFAPTPEDIVPQCAVNAYQLARPEENYRKWESLKRSRGLNIYVVTDDIIYEYVRQFQRCTFPHNSDVYEALAVELRMQKTDTVLDLREAIARHKQGDALQLQIGGFRMWQIVNALSTNPLLLPLMCDEMEETVTLDRFASDGEMRCCVYLYVQQPSTLSSFLSGDAKSLTGCVGREEGRSLSVRSIPLQSPVRLDSVRVVVECYGHCKPHWTLRLCLVDVLGYSLEYEQSCLAQDRNVLTFGVNPEHRPFRLVECRLDVPEMATRLRIVDIQLSPPVTALPGLLPPTSSSNNSGCAVLPDCTGEHALVFFKYFNVNSCRIMYAGSALLPLSTSISTCGHVLRLLLGDSGNLRGPLRMLQEKGPTSCALHNNDSLASLQIERSGVLIGQLEDVPLLYRFLRAEGYSASISNVVMMKLCMIVFEDPAALHEDDNHCEGCPSGAAASGCSGKCDSDMFGDAAAIEVVSSEVGGDTDAWDGDFNPIRAHRVVGLFKRAIDTTWSYEEVCEAIGAVFGEDPNYILLYRAKKETNPLRPEMGPPHSKSVSMHFASTFRYLIIYFNVLQKPRREVEAQQRVIVMLRTKKNKLLYKEEILVQCGQVTYEDLVRGTLERCARALRRVDVGRRNDNDSDINHSSCSSNAAASVTIETHYLALLVDVRAGAIREIIEVPMSTARSSNSSSSCCAGGSHSGNGACRLLVGVSEETLIISLVPVPALQEGQWRLACCCGHLVGGSCGVKPYMLIYPFALTVPDHVTVAEACEIILEYTGVPPQKVESGGWGVLMYTETIRRFGNWDDALRLYWKNTENRGDRIPSLLLNHKRPERTESCQGTPKIPTLRIAL